MNDNLEEVYAKLWETTAELIENHKPEAVAGAMVAQALTIYKTILSDIDYENMVDTISNTRDRVQKLQAPNIQ
jgi:hypothetical protein